MLKKLQLKSKCLGGGRINHDAENKTIKVYGYSQVILTNGREGKRGVRNEW